MKTDKNSPLQNMTAIVPHFLRQMADEGSEQITASLIDHLSTEIPQLKLYLRTEQIELKSRDFRPLIHATLQELMKLTGSLVAYVDAQELCEPTTPLGRLCNTTCQHFDELISTLSKEYADCLPQHIYVPEGYRIISAYQLFHALADLVDAFRAQETSPLLIDILMVPFTECTQDGADITLARLNYLKLLKLQLRHGVQQASARQTPIDEIIQIMFRALNFNSITAMQYTIHQIHTTLQTLEDVESRHRYLAYCRTSIMFTPPLEKGLSLHPELPTLNDQLLNWVNDEDDRLMRMDRSEPLVLNLAPKMPIGIPNTHLALLTRIQVKAKVYACSQYQAIKVTSQIFCTAAGEPIGAKAYENNFKESEIQSSTVRGVLERLENCIAILKADHGHLL